MKKMLPLLFMLPLGVQAEMPDPTRPPAAWLAPEALAGEGGGEAAGPRLQSVLLPERGRPVAVISGKTVLLGERVGEARLVGLTERAAVLRGPEGVTRLYLTPEVDKKMIDKPRSRQSSKAGRKKELP